MATPLPTDKPEQETAPAAVHPPILLETGTPEAVKPLFDFIQMLEAGPNTRAAAAEEKRLAPYFAAMSRHLRGLAPPGEPPSAEKLLAPERLSGLFNAAAARTHNTILSEFAILPGDVLKEGPAAALFKGRPQFQAGYAYKGTPFTVGFLQVFQGGSEKTARSSTSFPVLLLDAGMLGAVAKHKPEAMLREAQAVMSFVNHDMLHHFTSPIVNGIVAHKFRRSFFDWVAQGFRGEEGKLRPWISSLPRHAKSGRGLYEEWAHMSQEKILLSPGNEAEIGRISGSVTRYFDELGRLGRAVAAGEEAGKAHGAVDYFGMIMAHALLRVFPLDHPVMAQCLSGWKAADPASDPAKAALADAVETFFTRDKQPWLFDNHLPALQRAPDVAAAARAVLISSLRQSVAEDKELGQIAQAYHARGLELLPQDDAGWNFESLKLLCVAKTAPRDVHAHVPAPVEPSLVHMRAASDKALLDMVRAAGQTFRYAG